MSGQKRVGRYPAEVRERAVRMVGSGFADQRPTRANGRGSLQMSVPG
jgi:hypothetical protein